MRVTRLYNTVLALSLMSAAGFAVIDMAPAAQAQSQISGDLAGTVTDPSGAVIPNAQITVKNTQTGLTKTATSNATGSYRVALLPAGSYTVTATAPGFQTSSLNVTISTASVATGDLKLSVGQGTQTIEVTEAAPLLQTENSQISTSFTEQQIQTIPNPGNDITYYAQTSPGVIMNTGGGGYGNFSAFGLPGTSNNFTLNGAQVNDPFLNLNNSGPSNLLLGQNDVAEVAVVANAYDAAFGSFGGVQLNETTRTGTNRIHGNATYYYNGAYFNSNNWFLNNAGDPKPNTVNNQWAVGIGGPLVKDKTFWFLDWEVDRFVTSTPTRVSIPTPAYQAFVLANLANGGMYGDPNVAAEIPYYQKIFALYNNAAAGNRLQYDPTYDPDANFYEAAPKTSLREGLLAARVDQNLSSKDHMFVHAEYDVGRQPTYSDPLYPQWSMTSRQPEWEGQLAWIRTFTPNVTNQLLVTGAHYSAIFQSVNYQAAQSLLPFALLFADTTFYPLNYLDYDFPQGRNATQYQVADDFSWTKGRHTFKAGFIFKRDDVSNYDLGIYNNPLVEVFGSHYSAANPNAYCDAPNGGTGYDAFCFNSGYFYLNRQVFPRGQNNSAVGGTGTGIAPHVPIAFYNLGPYVEDVMKLTPKVTITAGIRFEHNSNPVCQTNCFSRLNNSFWNIAGNDTNDTPYNAVLGTGYHQAFNHLWSFLPEPRIGVNYQFSDKTVIRAGFGMFADVFPAQVTDYLARNAPLNPRFQALGVTGFGNLAYLAPTVPGNGFALNQGSNAAFFGNGGYSQGGSYSSIFAASGGVFSRPNIYTAEPRIQYPTYEEWSLQVQQQIGRNSAFQIAYVGNHGYHEPVVNNSANAYITVPGTGFDLPSSRPAGSFGEVVNIQSNASSNYNGMVVSFQHRSKILTTQVNWAWSHALDMVSNGGFLGFTASSLTGQIDPRNIRYNYGSADYDARHNITANYVLNAPNMAHLRPITNDWTISGTVFWRTGFPFTVVDDITPAASMSGYYAAIPAAYGTNPGAIPHHCGRSAVQNLNNSNGTGCFAPTDFVQANTFHDQERNQFTGPGFFDTDVSVLKGFKMPWEGGLFQVGVQAFNVLNHPNFGNPDSNISSPAFGYITNTVGAPTTIYGSGLGGDSSVRILQFKGNLRF